MRKVTPYLASGFPKTCWGCGKPFVVRNGHAEAIVGMDGNLYCYMNGCDEEVVAPHAYAVHAHSKTGFPRQIGRCGGGDRHRLATR